jgi:nicotinate-nucleotide adenylyltransferase
MSYSEMKNICLYIGSFDPPHVGHQIVAVYLLNQPDIDEVTIVPTYNHCTKENLSNYNHRCQMLSRAFQQNTNINISVIEKILAEQYAYTESRTHDTIRHLQKNNPTHKYHLAMGSDLFNTFTTWHNLSAYVDVPIKMILREGYKVEQSNQLGIEELGIKFTIINPEMPISNISSTAIKQKIVRGESIRGIVPHSVIVYIYTHKDLLDSFQMSQQANQISLKKAI